MRRIAALVLTGALVLSACTSTEVPQSAQTTAPPTPTPKPPRLPVKGVALPVVVAKAGRPLLESAWMNPPLESYSQPFTDHLLNALRRVTEFMAGYRGATGGRCGNGRVSVRPGATTTCTVSYRGLPVRWRVVIAKDEKPGDNLILYDATPIDAVLLAEAVHTAYWDTHRGFGSELRCSSIPAISIVPAGRPTRYQCQYLERQNDTSDPPSPPRWENTTISVEQYLGIAFG
jgi:hypothetical protein